MSSHHTKEITQSQSRTKQFPVKLADKKEDFVRDQSFSGVYPIWKERSETLADLLLRFRSLHGLQQSDKLTYAGRLDPMAEGVVLILAGESRFEKDTLLGLIKVYEVEVLLGVATDTEDVLGVITNVDVHEVAKTQIAEVVDTITSITTLPYPMYSSVLVDGQPLFTHARAGNTVEIPQKKVTLYSAALVDIQTETLQYFSEKIIDDIQKVSGDFRQSEIKTSWQECAESEGDKMVTVVRIKVEASSGAYMRSLASWIGERLAVPALAYRIIRTSVGEYTLEKPENK